MAARRKLTTAPELEPAPADITIYDEVPGELLDMTPSFVQLGRTYVNPAYVAAVEAASGGGCKMWVTGVAGPFTSTSSAADVVAALTAP